MKMKLNRAFSFADLTLWNQSDKILKPELSQEENIPPLSLSLSLRFTVKARKAFYE